MAAAIIDILAAQYATGSDRQPIRAHIVADAVADLPTVNTFTGYALTIGSVCDVIQTGARYMMDSGGSWYEQLHDVGADVYTKQQTDTLLNEKQDTLTPGVNMDTTPTQSSTNAVTSGGVYAAIAAINFLRVGEQIPEETAPGVYNDLDAYFTPGVFYVGSAGNAQHITNTPYPAAGKLIVMPLWASTRLIQIYISVDLGVIRIHIRRCYVNSGVPSFMNWYLLTATEQTPT